MKNCKIGATYRPQVLVKIRNAPGYYLRTPDHCQAKKVRKNREAEGWTFVGWKQIDREMMVKNYHVMKFEKL